MAKINKYHISTTKIKDVELISLPKIHDPRGNLSVIENGTIPFIINRVYYLYDVPSDAFRGGHAHIAHVELLVAVSGSFEVVVDDGGERKNIMLNKPNQGLLLPVGIWRELTNFSSGSVCLVLASEMFDEEDYIRDFDKFKSIKNS